jgi:hypothetical protein
MKYIGNFRSWLDKDWLPFLLSNNGTPRPSSGKTPNSSEEHAEYERARSAGYKDTDTYFYMFDKGNFPFDVNPPFINGLYHWWITKMLPGNFMPMHTDPHTLYEKNSNRYWIPLQDWHPGHLFAYNDTVITNYQAGDVWCYEDATALHGAANIGHIPRLVLQISTYEE